MDFSKAHKGHSLAYIYSEENYANMRESWNTSCEFDGKNCCYLVVYTKKKELRVIEPVLSGNPAWTVIGDVLFPSSLQPVGITKEKMEATYQQYRHVPNFMRFVRAVVIQRHHTEPFLLNEFLKDSIIMGITPDKIEYISIYTQHIPHVTHVTTQLMLLSMLLDFLFI